MLRFFSGALVKASKDAMVAGVSAVAIKYLDDKIFELTKGKNLKRDSAGDGFDYKSEQECHSSKMHK